MKYNKNNIEDIFYSGPFGGSGGSSGGSRPFGSAFNFGPSSSDRPSSEKPSFEIPHFDTSSISRPFAERKNPFDLKCEDPVESTNWMINPLGTLGGVEEVHYSWKEDRYGNAYDEHLTFDLGEDYGKMHIPNLLGISSKKGY